MCPLGWISDPDLGPCGRYNISTSKWGGISRCPGLVDAVTGDELENKANYASRLFLSINPVLNGNKHNGTQSTIEYFNYFSGPYPGVNSTGVIFLNLTSNSSAGPLVIDDGKHQLFFVDANPVAPFIGLASIDSLQSTYTHFLSLSAPVFGFACDARPNQRKLFWTVPKSSFVNDGGIYWAYMDIFPATTHSLVSIIGQSYVSDPMGIAVHMLESRIYWVDKTVSSDEKRHSVLRSCKTDGSDYTEVFVYKAVGNHVVSTNATDLVIDFAHNNTAFFIDSSTSGPAIISTNLDFPFYPQNISDPSKFSYFNPTSLICTTRQDLMGNPTYLTLDDTNNIMMWTDNQLLRVRANWYMDTNAEKNPLNHTDALLQNPFGPLGYFGAGLYRFETKSVFLVPQTEINLFRTPAVPVGLALDKGLGGPLKFGNYKECFGNGRCSGSYGNFVCECYDGFFGNCETRSCPRGLTWFNEPALDNIAHDEYVECSNKGSCDRIRGLCKCQPGFEVRFFKTD